MQDPFDQKKQAILEEINSSNLDASPKGTIDEKCLPIITLINNDINMVTTSSCSGRISVFLEGKPQGNTKIITKGNEGRWLFVTHNSEDLPNWYHGIDFKYSRDEFPVEEGYRNILFKFEPLILHVKCRDLNQASKLYTIAMNCGFRESGIGSNYNVAIRISIKLDIPIGYANEQDQLISFVSKEYLEYITKLSNERFTENFRKLNQLYDAIEKMIGTKEQPVVKEETKEERRERKIREGLQRQQQLKNNQ
ncbi:tRNA wybutosine-synthesizing protein 3 [Spathaspora sp. JA1]|nr:tRNA wybutosine-synthesizing protein 3 [Spathaspora sp. JA1]